MRRTSTMILALALLGAGASRVDAGSVKLRYRWRAGDEAHYRLRMKSRTAVQVGDRYNESEMTTVLNMSQRVMAVGADQVARVLTRVDSGQVSTGDGPRKMMPPRETTMRIDARGTILDGQMPASRLAPLRMVFPEEPVSVGDSWTSAQPPTQEIPVPIQIRYTITGHKEIDGLPCAEIGIQIQSAQASAAVDNPMELSFQAAGALYFAYEQGLMVQTRIESDLKVVLRRPVDLGMEDVETTITMDLALEYRPGL